MKIRTAIPTDAHAIARVHVETWQTTYRGIVPDAVLDKMSVEQRLPRWQELLADDSQAGFTLVAEDDDGQVVGFACAGPNRGDEAFEGELYAIYVLQAHQGAGTGKRLAMESMRRLQTNECSSMIVWALQANDPARRFYDALGGVYVSSKPITIGGTELIEVSYGWERLPRFSD